MITPSLSTANSDVERMIVLKTPTRAFVFHLCKEASVELEEAREAVLTAMYGGRTSSSFRHSRRRREMVGRSVQGGGKRNDN